MQPIWSLLDKCWEQWAGQSPGHNGKVGGQWSGILKRFTVSRTGKPGAATDDQCS